MTKISNQYSLTNVLFADAVNGRVGIGTASPTVALDVVGAGRFSSNINGGFIGLTIKNTSTGTNACQMSMQTNSQDWLVNVRTDNHFSIYNNTAATTPFIITTGGNVGIGTTFSYAKMDIFQDTAGFGGWKYMLSLNATDYPAIRLLATTGNTGSIIAHELGSTVFLTGTNSTTAGAERMRITSAGNVLIGTTSNLSGSAARIELLFGSGASFGINSKITLSEGVHVNFINSSGTQVGYIYTTAAATIYATGSDYRLKEDLKEIKGIELLSKINFYNFKWKSEDSRTDGVIAHELQAVLPYAVTGVKDGSLTQAVDYGRLTPVIGRAVQELNNQIQEQQLQINELKALLNA